MSIISVCLSQICRYERKNKQQYGYHRSDNDRKYENVYQLFCQKIVGCVNVKLLKLSSSFFGFKKLIMINIYDI